MELAKQQYNAIGIGLHALFNEAGGYVSYVIPAVFVLILHQTLILGTGILGGSQNEQLESGAKLYWENIPASRLLVVRTGIFFMIYIVLSMYYFGPSFQFYDIPRLATLSNLVLLLISFLLSTIFLGVALGTLFPRREIATLIVLLSSMPIVFASGFIWPASAIPSPILTVLQLIPAIPAIKAFVLLNQMGAELQQIRPFVTHLSLLSMFYGIIAYLLLKWKILQQNQE